MSSAIDRIRLELQKRKDNSSLRKLSVSENLIDFCSNDYLGLASNSMLANLVLKELEIHKPKVLAATGSRLLSGNHSYHLELENQMAGFFKGDAALLFNSGYAANSALLSTVAKKNDLILYDEYSHASIKEGYRLSYATQYSFKHNNVDDLISKLEKFTTFEAVFIVVESVYSMDGDICPLDKISQVAKKYNANLIIDEAHSTGIFGKYGEGLSVNIDAFAKVFTFGKAIGAHGACVVGSQELKEYLINFAQGFIYTTALPYHSVKTLRIHLEYLKQNPELQNQIRSKIQYFRSQLIEFAFTEFLESDSCIQACLVQGNEKCKNVAQELQKNGFDVRPVLSPTVPKGKERLRICLHLYNTNSQIIDLLTLLKKLLA